MTDDKSNEVVARGMLELMESNIDNEILILIVDALNSCADRTKNSFF